MTALDSSWLTIWESVAEWGFVLVFIGVIGEGAEISIKIFNPLLYKNRERCLDMIGGVFWAILVLGLGVELLGTHRARLIADRINSGLNEEAGKARIEAGQANERAEQTALKVEEYRKANDELEAKLQLAQTRRITPKQRNAFIENTRNLAKGPVQIFVCAGEFSEPKEYARQIRQMLDGANYGAKAGSGITEIDNLSYYSFNPIGDDARDVPLQLCLYGTNIASLTWPQMVFTYNGATINANFVPSGSNAPLPGVINLGLNAAGIPFAWGANTQFLKPGEWGIFIPKKF